MSIARINTALSQHKKTILKYGVLGGVIGGSISATIGSLVELKIEYGKLCHIAGEMAPNYNCTIFVTRGPHNTYSCNPRCSLPANASLLMSDADSKNSTRLPAVAEFSAALGVGVGFLMGATYGIYTAIKNSRTSLTVPLISCRSTIH
jgi:hypothetical protein